jgi:hypothetical protein
LTCTNGKNPTYIYFGKKGMLFKNGPICGENWETVTLFLLEKHKKGYFKTRRWRKRMKNFLKNNVWVEPPEL